MCSLGRGIGSEEAMQAINKRGPSWCKDWGYLASILLQQVQFHAR